MTAAVLDDQVRLDLLGGFRMRVGSLEMSVSDVAKCVIASVALSNRQVRRDRLAGMAS
jgi:hypothetical protein